MVAAAQLGDVEGGGDEGGDGGLGRDAGQGPVGWPLDGVDEGDAVEVGAPVVGQGEAPQADALVRSGGRGCGECRPWVGVVGGGRGDEGGVAERVGDGGCAVGLRVGGGAPVADGVAVPEQCWSGLLVSAWGGAWVR